jgi:putative ABC transport system substrate-binding protein
MKRREFIKVFGGTAATWPLAARAQQVVPPPVIGFLNAASPQAYEPMLSAYLKGLNETSYIENQNVKIEYRWAQGEVGRLAAFTEDLVRREVSVIAATGTPAALAAKAATTTIPIVFETGSDPVQLGLVASLNRPGGNVTGVSQLAVEVAPKRLQLLHEAIPTVRLIVVVVDPTDPVSAKTTEGVHAAAQSLGLELQVLDVSTDQELDAIFPHLVQLRAGGLVVGGGQFLNSRRRRLAEMALQHSIPTIFPYRDFSRYGGLMSYGSSITDAYRIAGIYTGRILKGEKPQDLPVEQATKVELTINLATAKALGINVPNSLIGRADEVIE